MINKQWATKRGCRCDRRHCCCCSNDRKQSRQQEQWRKWGAGNEIAIKIKRLISGLPGSNKCSSRRGTFTTTSPIKMDTTQAISSVLPPPPSQEELWQLCFNNQHYFITNKSRFSRPDHHPPKVINNRQDLSIRQDLNPRSGPNLRQPRSDLNCSCRRALLQQVQVPRQQVQVSGPVLQIPPPQQWIWVHNRNIT